MRLIVVLPRKNYFRNLYSIADGIAGLAWWGEILEVMPNI